MSFSSMKIPRTHIKLLINKNHIDILTKIPTKRMESLIDKNHKKVSGILLLLFHFYYAYFYYNYSLFILTIL